MERKFYGLVRSACTSIGDAAGFITGYTAKATDYMAGLSAHLPRPLMHASDKELVDQLAVAALSLPLPMWRIKSRRGSKLARTGSILSLAISATTIVVVGHELLVRSRISQEVFDDIVAGRYPFAR